MKNCLRNTVNFKALLMTSVRCLNFLKEVTYLYKLMEAAGSHTNERFYRELLIDMGLILTTWQHSLKIHQSRVQIGNIWRDISAPLYTDALKLASLLSLTLPNDDINIVQGIQHSLKSHSSLKKLTFQNPAKWPVTKVVLSKPKDENGGKVYQGS